MDLMIFLSWMESSAILDFFSFEYYFKMAAYCVVCSHVYEGHMPVTCMQKPEGDINVFLRFLLYFWIIFFVMYGFLHPCMPVCLAHVWCPRWLEEGVGSSGPGVTDSCEPPSGCWESNLGPLAKQPVLLTAELAVKVLNFDFLTEPGTCGFA